MGLDEWCLVARPGVEDRDLAGGVAERDRVIVAGQGATPDDADVFDRYRTDDAQRVEVRDDHLRRWGVAEGEEYHGLTSVGCDRWCQVGGKFSEGQWPAADGLERGGVEQLEGRCVRALWAPDAGRAHEAATVRRECVGGIGDPRSREVGEN